eukprot:4422549-Amphidinium_carterae.1
MSWILPILYTWTSRTKIFRGSPNGRSDEQFAKWTEVKPVGVVGLYVDNILAGEEKPIVMGLTKWMQEQWNLDYLKEPSRSTRAAARVELKNVREEVIHAAAVRESCRVSRVASLALAFPSAAFALGLGHSMPAKTYNVVCTDASHEGMALEIIHGGSATGMMTSRVWPSAYLEEQKTQFVL